MDALRPGLAVPRPSQFIVRVATVTLQVMMSLVTRVSGAGGVVGLWSEHATTTTATARARRRDSCFILPPPRVVWRPGRVPRTQDDWGVGMSNRPAPLTARRSVETRQATTACRKPWRTGDTERG